MLEKTKVNKIYNILLRMLIVVFTYGFIYKKVFLEKDFSNLAAIFRDLFWEPSTALPFLLVILMMLLNWGLETVKWRYLISKIEQIPFFKAFEAVLTGSSVSFFTPNRVGEYFGRVFILDKGSHIQGILITILGSISQLIITILTGTLALLAFRPGIVPELQGYPGLLYFSVLGIIILLDAMLVLFYFNISLLSGFRRRFSMTRYWKFFRFLRIFRKYSTKELLFTLMLSLLRYLVFSLQYYILLRIFRVNVPFINGMIIISLVFFVITVFPTVALTELGVRDTAALYFFSLYFGGFMDDATTIGVVSATTFLWLLNILIPAAAGTFFVYRLKFFRLLRKKEAS